VKSSPQAFQLFGIKNVPKDLLNGKRVEKGSTESPGKDSTFKSSVCNYYFLELN
jgi:hypothetical protein